MGVSKNSGTRKWMVFLMENPINMDDLGVPLLLETPTYWCSIFCLRTFVPFDSAEIFCFLRWAWNIQTSWIYSVHSHFMTFLCQDIVCFLAKPKQSLYKEHMFFSDKVPMMHECWEGLQNGNSVWTSLHRVVLARLVTIPFWYLKPSDDDQTAFLWKRHPFLEDSSLKRRKQGVSGRYLKKNI